MGLSGELKTRVNTCLHKLSDRDTLSMAASELENIARTLPNDAFAPFLNCLSATDSSEKSPVRRQCVRLLGVLSAAHGDALSPHLSRMVSAVVRRLRDPDSAVRGSCVDAVASIAAHVGSPSAALLKLLVDALFREQEASAQIGAAMCLSAAVEAAPDPDSAELRRILPRVLKMARGDCLKARPALLLFVCSIVGSGCVKGKGLLGSVVSTAVEFLSSEDWSGRKAAAEVLEKVAAVERNSAAEFKGCCVDALESRRFDKVKLVREIMNRALEMWKDLPELSEDTSILKDTQSPVVAKVSPASTCLKTPQTQKAAPAISSQKCTLERKPNSRKNFGSRVVPFDCNENTDMAKFKDDFGNQNEYGDMSLIRKQLMQIENQQSNLLDLLQRFIGSSQKGMSSLEKRVDGLEKVLDEMSLEFTISTRRMSGSGSDNTCCMLPGAEFLSPKFWRGNNLHSKFCSPFRNQGLHG